MPRIVNSASGDIVLDGSGNGSFTIPLTTEGNLQLLFTFTTSALSPTAQPVGDTPCSIELDTAVGPIGNRHVLIYSNAGAHGGMTQISFTGGTSSTSMGIIYLEYAGLAFQGAVNTINIFGSYASDGVWTSTPVSPTGSNFPAVLIGFVYGEADNDALSPSVGFTRRIQFAPSAGHTIAIEDKEIEFIGSGPYTASGYTAGGGAQGAPMILKTTGIIQDTLWARTQL